MAITAFGAQSLAPVITPEAVQIGNTRIPLGSVTTSFIDSDSRYSKEFPVVRIHTTGGMDLERKDVILDFRLRTIEKTHQFFRELMEYGKVSFNLSAWSLSPSVVKSNEQWQGIVDLRFGTQRLCEEFDATARTVFFPTFASQMLSERTILRLTAEAGTELDIVRIMNGAFSRLNIQTHFEVGELLHKNGNPQFFAVRPLPGITALPRRDPHYFVEPDGTVQKEMPHRGKMPEGHIPMWDEEGGLYYALEPLTQPAEAQIHEIMETLRAHVDFGMKLSARSPSIAQKISKDVIRMRVELERTEPRSPLDWEVLNNFLRSPKTSLAEDEIVIAMEVAAEGKTEGPEDK